MCLVFSKRKIINLVVLLVVYFMGFMTVPFIVLIKPIFEQAQERRVLNRCDSKAVDARKLAERAAQYVRDNGTEVASAEFSKRESEFFNDDMNIFVINNDGVMLVNPSSPATVGKNFIHMIDVHGKLVFKPMTEIDSEGWVEYMWVHPVTRATVIKKSYIVNIDGYRVGVGVYCE